MPQMDRYKNRKVYIEFVANENFINLPYEERLTITFITSGSINLQLNDRPVKIIAPSILCLSTDDKIQVIEKHNLASQSFCFHPDFFNTAHFSETQGYLSTNLKIDIGLALFEKDNVNNGVYAADEKVYLKLYEWFFIMGTEVYAAHNNGIHWLISTGSFPVFETKQKKELIEIIILFQLIPYFWRVM